MKDFVEKRLREKFIEELKKLREVKGKKEKD